MEQVLAQLADMEEFICAAPDVLVPRIRHAALARLLQDWQARCADRLLPARGHFQPEDLGYILGNLILWDIQPEPLTATYRLYGSNFAVNRSGEMTGKTMDQLPDPVMRKLSLHGLRRVMAERQPLLTRGRYRLQGGITVAMETLTLPLASDGRNIDMILHGQFNDTLGYGVEPVRDLALRCAAPAILQDAIADARLVRLLREWDGWRGGRTLPARTDFKPEMLGYLLGNLLLFDIERPAAPDSMPRFRYRLFGSSIAAFRDFDLTGRCLDEHPDSVFGIRAHLVCLQSVQERLPVRVRAAGRTTDGLSINFEALMLPLAEDGEVPDRMLAAQVMDGT